MTTQEVANAFNDFAQKGQWDKIVETLFHPDCESIEPPHAVGLTSVKGVEAIIKKGELFNESIEAVHGGYSTAPVVGGTHFSIAMGLDVTFKGQERTNIDEICVYEVKDGKIIKEQFFY
jgi:limonene-1,2-epoxide hydrolase